MIKKRACPEPGRRVFVGMSGGVDSSVSAGLLKKAGYEVIGVFIRVWEPAGFVCTWREERREARRVAAHLDIPLLTLDLSQEYKKKVVDYFISEYQAGRTPNPDVMCNKHIKFGVFYDWAMENGADFVATGHYSRIAQQKEDLPSPGHKGKVEVKSSFCFAQSRDLDKDQTYFLWNLKTEQLSKILFPIGGYTKQQVRALAKKFGLPNAEKKDSQGLCFIGKIDFKDFLKREVNGKKGTCPERSRGNVLNEQGEIIGQHDGVMFFTLGERHGFEIFVKSPDEKPYYVIDKDVKKNTLTVSQNPQLARTEKLEVEIEQTNWIGNEPEIGKKYQARIRYRQPLQNCKITALDKAKKTATIIFAKPQLAASGQSLVLYDKDVCLGGGIIK